jgi:phenylalanyl-tRNA synthetase alpha chain
MLSYEIKTTFDHALSPEGSQIAAKGSHEALVWAALPLKGQGEPMGIPELKVGVAVFKDTAELIKERSFNRKWSETRQQRSDRERLSRTSGLRRRVQVSSRL